MAAGKEHTSVGYKLSPPKHLQNWFAIRRPNVLVILLHSNTLGASCFSWLTEEWQACEECVLLQFSYHSPFTPWVVRGIYPISTPNFWALVHPLKYSLPTSGSKFPTRPFYKSYPTRKLFVCYCLWIERGAHLWGEVNPVMVPPPWYNTCRSERAFA